MGDSVYTRDMKPAATKLPADVALALAFDGLLEPLSPQARPYTGPSLRELQRRPWSSG